MRMDAHATYPANYIVDLVDCMERTAPIASERRGERAGRYDDHGPRHRGGGGASVRDGQCSVPPRHTRERDVDTLQCAPTGATCSSGWGRSTKIY